MAEITIEFPDGSKDKFKKGITPKEIAEKISQRLARESIAAEFNGQLIDLQKELNEDGKLKLLTFNDPKGREVFWHSSSHLMAEAVLDLWPDAKLTIGPAIDEGFYYDFDLKHTFTPEDLKKIEDKMLEHVQANEMFSRLEKTRKEALDFYKNNEFKRELINELPEEMVSFYSNGKFIDMCKGPHIPSTSIVKAVKLLKVAGAYWRGSEKNKMLQRIYGITFPEKSMLDAYLKKLEEAKNRSHIKLGHELALFSIHEEAPGFPFIKANGMILWQEIEKLIKEELFKRDYILVQTPIILNKKLWLQSGHWEHYRENMYFTEIDEDEFAVKPMNCPGHILIYKENRHSYRELPIRIAEFGIVHRHEKSGVLNGLVRVRKFTQDDAHIFCMEEQIKKEVLDLLDFVDKIYKVFNFNYKIELSTRPEKFMGDIESWEKAEQALNEALNEKRIKFTVKKGEGAFYGPKIDFHVEDSLGRTWQLATIQLDFQMPQKFNLYYIGSDDKEHMPVMIHRAIFGSLERFLGILIEHFAASFPTWLAPIQARVISINENTNDYAKKIREELKNHFIRADLDLRNETINKKVRDAQLLKIPYMLTLGEKEMKSNTITVRDRTGKLKFNLKLAEFIEKIKNETNERSLELKALM